MPVGGLAPTGSRTSAYTVIECVSPVCISVGLALEGLTLEIEGLTPEIEGITLVIEGVALYIEGLMLEI